MGVGQLSESDAVDALRLPFYSSSHPTGSHGWRNQFDLGNPIKVSWNAVASSCAQVFHRLYEVTTEPEFVVRHGLAFFNDPSSPVYRRRWTCSPTRESEVSSPGAAGCCLWWRGEGSRNYCSGLHIAVPGGTERPVPGNAEGPTINWTTRCVGLFFQQNPRTSLTPPSIAVA